MKRKRKKKHWTKVATEVVWRSCKEAAQRMEKWFVIDDANWLIPLLAALAMAISHMGGNF